MCVVPREYHEAAWQVNDFTRPSRGLHGDDTAQRGWRRLLVGTGGVAGAGRGGGREEGAEGTGQLEGGEGKGREEGAGGGRRRNWEAAELQP
jgi:hypothetical protein